MAGELQATAPTGSVVYGQLLDRLTGRFWNTGTAALEAYATANIAAYAVATAEQGVASGVFLGNLPAAGNLPFLILYRIQAGAGPAEADILTDRQEIGVRLADSVLHGGPAALAEFSGGDGTVPSLSVKNLVAGGIAAKFLASNGGNDFFVVLGDGYNNSAISGVSQLSGGEVSQFAWAYAVPGYADACLAFSLANGSYAGFDFGLANSAGGLGLQVYGSDSAFSNQRTLVLADGVSQQALNGTGGFRFDSACIMPFAEAYAAPGAMPTLGEAVSMIWTMLSGFGISGVTLTTKKIDGTTDNMTFTLDSPTNPTSISRTT